MEFTKLLLQTLQLSGNFLAKEFLSLTTLFCDNSWKTVRPDEKIYAEVE